MRLSIAVCCCDGCDGCDDYDERCVCVCVSIGIITDCQFSPDGQVFATCGIDGLVNVWDTKTGKLIVELNHPIEEAEINTVRFHPKQPWLLAPKDSNACIWDYHTGEEVFALEGKP